MNIKEQLEREVKDLSFISAHSKNKDSKEEAMRMLPIVKEKLRALETNQQE